MNEVTITIINSDSKLTNKHLDYEGIKMDSKDPLLDLWVREALAKFKAGLTNYDDNDIDIIIKSKMIWK